MHGKFYPHCSFTSFKKSVILELYGPLASQLLSKIPRSPRPPWMGVEEQASRGALCAGSPPLSSPGWDYPHSGLESPEPCPHPTVRPPPSPPPALWGLSQQLLGHLKGVSFNNLGL